MTHYSDADHRMEEATFEREERTSASSVLTSSSAGQLDLEAVVRASQALSTEMVLPRLIKKLVRIAVEYAGAERGLLILIRGAEPWIEAEANSGPDWIEVAVRQAPVTSSDLPQSVLLHVIQTQERVLLNDASADIVYSMDEYVQQKHSRSILCLPIVNQAKLAGAFYLENNLAPGAFTSDRVTVLQLLASRAAISLENASLYSDFELQVDLLQQLPVAAWTLNPDGTPDFVNRVWLEFAGQTLDFVRSNPEAWMNAVHPEDRERVIRTFWEGVSSGRGFVFENRSLRAQDGTYRWHLQQAVPLHDTQGKVLKFVGTTTDIDDQKRVEESLAALDRAKTTFFSNVSHEFRTPLTLMLGPLEEIQKEAKEQLSPERYELLATVHRNGLRLLKLVNNLLDFSRIEAGRAQASYQPTDLATFTAEIASAFDSALQNAGLHFSVECQPIAEPVYVDRDMWEKIVLNLVSNAYKFTFKGEVAVTLKPEDGAIVLRVRDTGVGIPEEHRGRVFERFHRIENVRARTYEGTGIGLALVQELVKLHCGTVRVESAIGAGSTFTVTIPRGKEHLAAERIQATQSLASTTIRAEVYIEDPPKRSGREPGVAADVENLGKLRSPSPSASPAPAERRELIVLADDNADMRQYLMRLLSDRYEVHAVANGREALEATQQLRPALVLADVMMPQLDGFGLLRAIREDSALAGTPVILVSARAGEESRVEGLEADADDYLVKPFAARELLARVAVHVKMANLRRETAEREERLRSDAELEREKRQASEERLAETNRLYCELQRADAELQLQVALLQQLPVSAWTLKPDGTPDFVNDVWLEFAGQTRDFVQSHPEAWMTAVHPEDREAASKGFWDGVHAGNDFSFQTRARRALDGVYRWHLNRAVVLRDAEGKVLKFVGTTTDIDDQKQAEEALRQAQADLARINRTTTMGELAASLAHEIGQPISGATTNLNVCLRKLGSDKPDLDALRAAITRTVRDVQRTADIVENIRSQFKKSSPKQGTLDVSETIREIIVLLRAETVRYGVSVRAELAADLPQVVGDRVQLQQVAMNLLVNSIEAMKDVDGLREMVVQSQQAEGNQILVSVSDTGIGIPTLVAEKIFDAFFTTKTHGTGMGLRISRSIIESHGGRLWATPNDGPGVTFSFSIPVAQQA